MKNLLLFLYLLCCIACQIEKKRDEAVMFRRNAYHAAQYPPSTLIDTLHGVKWKTKVEGNVFSSAAIYNDVVYIGSSEKFYALDAHNGNELWSTNVDGAAHSSPAVYGNVVYFGDFSGMFHALDTKDGSSKWTFRAEGERKFGARGLHGLEPRDQYVSDDWDFYNSSPTIYDQKIYFGSGNGKVYALDLNTGKELWSFQTGEVVHSSPAVAYGNVYVGSWDSYFYCLDATTGKKQWNFQTGIDTLNYNQVGIQSSPLVADSMVYFGCRDAHVYALDAITGKLIWKKFNNYSWIIASPIVDEEKLYYTTSDSYKFIALDKYTGDSLYSLPTKGFGFSSPVMIDHMIYYGVFNGDLVAVDTELKKEAWRFSTEEAIADNLKVLNKDGTLNGQKVFAEYSIRKMPEIMEMLFSVGAILSTPTPHDHSLIFGTADGHIYAIH